MKASSRNIDDAHPELQKRWQWIVNEYALLYPDEPQPQISQTYRNEIDQNIIYARGSSKVRYPHSTHNLNPSWALDYFFIEIENGKEVTSYRQEWIDRVGELGEKLGLFWGKRWGWDAAHLALVEKTSQTTIDSLKLLPELPEHTQIESVWKVKIYNTIQDGDDIITRVSVKDKTVHIRGEKKEES